MSETVDVIIATYGDLDIWEPLADRAARSAHGQDVFGTGQTVAPHEVHRVHGTKGSNLAHLRNVGARQSEADWLIFLDADDELDPHYIEHMLAGTGDMRWPSTLGVVDGVEDDEPVLLQLYPGERGITRNHMVIGTMVRREQFLAVGGFHNLPVLEDWECWIRLQLAGAVPMPCPEAIYRIHVRKGSRNHNLDGHGFWYAEIQNTYQAEWNAKGLN
jgi:glycosyltransferase involved in cell wall biosynthesis